MVLTGVIRKVLFTKHSYLDDIERAGRVANIKWASTPHPTLGLPLPLK